MKKTAEAIVVGGGVIGSAVAYYLAEEGVEVALVERGDVSSGTSSACDGNVLAISQKPGFESQTTLKSQRMLADLVERLDYDLDYTQRGSVLVVEDEEQSLLARDWVTQQKDAGLPMRYIEGNEVFEDEPLLARDVIGLVECASDSSLNPMALVHGFVKGAQRKGTRVYPFTEVKAILRDASGAVCGVATSTGNISSRYVVLAAGVWTPAIADTVGVTVPIRPRKGHILVAERTPRNARRKLMEFGYLMAKFGGKEKRNVAPDMERYGIAMVFEPTVHGNFLIGSSREFVGFDTRCNTHVLKLMAKRALRFFPKIGDVNVIRSYAGLRPYTPDHLSIVSPVPVVPGLYVAAGHEGGGIGLAPITGKVISEMIVGEPTSIPTEPLRLDRFGKKELSL
jgi:sarcosine oxidase subunit beta